MRPANTLTAARCPLHLIRTGSQQCNVFPPFILVSLKRRCHESNLSLTLRTCSVPWLFDLIPGLWFIHCGNGAITIREVFGPRTKRVISFSLHEAGYGTIKTNYCMYGHRRSTSLCMYCWMSVELSFWQNYLDYFFVEEKQDLDFYLCIFIA